MEISENRLSKIQAAALELDALREGWQLIGWVLDESEPDIALFRPGFAEIQARLNRIYAARAEQ